MPNTSQEHSSFEQSLSKSLERHLFIWLTLSLSLFSLEFFHILQFGFQYWGDIALSQWGIMSTLSLVVLMGITFLKKSLYYSWPKLKFYTWPRYLLTTGFLLLALLSVILGTQLSVEWASKQFRQVTYRGLFAGLIAALIACLNLVFMPILARLMMTASSRLSKILNLKQDVHDQKLNSKKVNAKQIKLALFLFTGLLVYYAEQVVILFLPKLETVDLRSVSILLSALWWTVAVVELFKDCFQKHLQNPSFKYFKPHFAVLGFMLISMGLGLNTTSQLSPEQFLRIDRDSALSSIMIKQFQKLSDTDQDGMSAKWGGGDCNDQNPKQRPGIIDQRQKDVNCNGLTRMSRQPFMPQVKAQSTNSTKKQLEKPAAIASPQNVILLTIDALRYDAFREQMPLTQEFAKKSVDFTKAYSAGAATYWSIPALLGSRPPSFFQMGRDQTPVNSERLLTEVLRDSAFHTALFANVTIFFVRGLSQGAYTKNYDTSRYTVHGAKPGAAHLTNGLIKHIDRWQAQKLKPQRDRFFVWGHYYDPHDPYFEVPTHPAQNQSSQERYKAIVRSVDQELGRLFKALEKRDLLKNTMIILTADHGDEFYDHNHRFHGKTLYDEMVKVPLLIYSPNYEPQKVDQVISHLDVAPTVLGHLGLAAEKRFMGFNHDQALRAKLPLSKDEAFFEVLPDQNYAKHMVGLRLGDEKLIYSLHQGAIEHYDLLTDPLERLNLFSDQRTYKNKEIYTKLMRYTEAQLYILSQGKAGVNLVKAK